MIDEGAVQLVGELRTTVVEAFALEPGQYVVLPEDADDAEVALLVDMQDGVPVLWRVLPWGEETMEYSTLRLDAPEGDQLNLTVVPGDEVRLVLPGQEHEVWD